VLDHDLWPGRTENQRDGESPRGRSSQRRWPAAVPFPGESINRVKGETVDRMRVDVSRAQECRECNGWGSLLEGGRVELCQVCQ
jgi:hypothetical protein